MNCFSTREGGFSLVELMVAVGIIGIMSSVAVPKYQKFRANAAQSEAQATLSSIYTLQQLYYTENDHYAVIDIEYDTTDKTRAKALKSTDELTFLPSPNARYAYKGDRYQSDKSTSAGATDAEAVAFKVVADAVTALASCSGHNAANTTAGTAASSKVDVWCVNQDKVMGNEDMDAAHHPCGEGTKLAKSGADFNNGGC